jgi:hypothetical protein
MIVGCCALAWFLPQTVGSQQSGNIEILKKARQSYYSLKSEGMAQFQCNISPNWAALLAETRKTNPAAFDKTMGMLKQLSFSVTVAANGSIKVLHSEIPADNEQTAKGLSQIYSGMEQMISGFFQTWSIFVLTPALPEPDSDFKLEDGGREYRLSYKDGPTEVLTTMGKDFAISMVKVTAKDFDSTLWPRFTKTANGFLLTGYQAEYKGKGGADKTELQVIFDYQVADGLQVPHKLNLKGVYNQSPFQVEVTFVGCHATKY